MEENKPLYAPDKEPEPKISSKQRRRNATVQRKFVNHIKPGTKGRKLMSSLKIDRVNVAMQRMTGNQAIKFLHPRRLREAIINKTIPDGVFTPSGDVAQ